MLLPRTLNLSVRSIGSRPPSVSIRTRSLHANAFRLRPGATTGTSSFVDVQHSEFLARAGNKPVEEVTKDSQTADDVKKRVNELEMDGQGDERWTGKLTPTTSHLFKLVLPIPKSLAAYTAGSSGSNLENSTKSTAQTTPDLIETAYLLHPSQPLSHVSRLILGSLPSSERSAEVEFRAVSGRDHDAYPSSVDAPSSMDSDMVGPEGGPILNDRKPGGEELQEVRWSTSTDLGDFIKQSTLAQSFKIVVRPEDGEGANDAQGMQAKGSKKESLVLKVKIPTFASRTVYLRRRLLSLTKEIAKMTEQKKE